MLTEKQCSTCKEILSVDCFYKRKTAKSGLASQCKNCHHIWTKENKDKVKKYKTKHSSKESSKYKKRLWTIENRESINKRSNEIRFAKRWEGRTKVAPIGAKESRRRYYAKNKHKWSNDRTTRKVNAQKAKPAWSNVDIVISIYAMAKWLTEIVGVKYHVDHIVPLRHTLVCGLHSHDNLSIITAKSNLKKGNRYWPDMP